MLARRAHKRANSSTHAPPLSPSSSSPSSPMSPTSPHCSPPSLPAMPPLGIQDGLTVGICVASPGSPPSTAPLRHTTILPAPSIQKYSDQLRRALSARFEVVAAAARNAPPPPPNARFEDPDYGFDEDPFETNAKLLLSMHEPLTSPAPVGHQPTSSAPEESYFDLASDTELDTPPPRRWSIASVQSRLDTNGVSTPSSDISYLSEASFEAGRASDWINLYGRTKLRTPPVTSRRNSVSSLGPPKLTPLQALRQAPSPQPPRRLRRRPGHPYELADGTATPPETYEPLTIARTTSESMILAAGLSSQRERRRGNAP